MTKRGQITVFVILGVMLLFATATIFYVLSLQEEEPLEVPAEVSSVKLYIDSCIEDTAKNAIVDNSLQGGFYQLPQLSTEDSPYYFYRLERRVPSLNELEIQLGFYMEDKLKECIDVSQFSEQGIEIELGDISSNAVILQDNVMFNLDFPVTISRGRAVTTIQEFATVIENIRLAVIHNASSSIVGEQANDPYSLCLSCLAEIAEQNKLSIDTLNLEGDSVLLTIIDQNSLINQKPLVFRFANKYIPYDCGNLPSTLPDSVLQSKLIECAQQR